MERMIDGGFSLSGTQWILLLGLFALVFQPVLVGDLFGYLVYGDWMIRAGEITRVDRYSFTAIGKTWINHEWLFHLLVGAIFRVSGWSGLFLLQGLFVGAILYVMGLLAADRDTTPGGWLMTLTVPVLAVVPGLTLRPQLITYLGILGLVLWFRTDRRLFWYDFLIVPLLFVVWSNVHGGMLIGLAFLGFLLGSRVFLRPGRDRLLRSTVLLAGCLAGTLVTPYGFDLWAMILETVNDPLTAVFIEEWRPTWVYPYHLAVWCLLGLQWVVLVYRNRTQNPRVILLRVVCLLAIGLLSLWPRRNLTYYGLAVVAFAPGWRLSWGRTINVPKELRHGVIVGVLFGALALIGTTVQGGFSPGDRAYPGSLLEEIDTNNGPEHVFVYYPWAQWAFFRNRSIRVFLDGRWKTVYSDEVIRDYGKILVGSSTTLSEYDIDRVLLPDRYRLNNQLANHDNWSLVARTRDTLLWKHQGNGSTENE